MTLPEAAGHDLVSFVPRLTLEWLRDRPEELSFAADGTLAFVDISGFTAMSEQLSSRGKAGAEEVTEVMNATFAALLEVGYAEGGGLLKFGGDALLLFFDGEEHAARAARAAFRMRKLLDTIGRPETSAGEITLRMHAGLHSGRFEFFLVGDSHRELLVAGPAATRTVEMEAGSEAGEILLSPEAAAQLDPSLLGEEKANGVLLAGEPETQSRFVLRPDIEAIPLEQAVPAPLRSQLMEVGPLEGEHRAGAVAFIRFSGVDTVIEEEGRERAAEALDALVRAIQGAADAHNVTFLESDVDRDGGRIILVAGAPQTFGDDEERLLRTLRAAVDASLPFRVHVGASRGRVFAGQVGASFRRTYTLLGDTAALAARLMARAGADEIWVTAEAFERGGARFEATKIEPFHVKGKAAPVNAVALGPLRVGVGETGGEERKLPFVDRERERAVLGAALAPVRLGFGTLVELIGEPGIGKSRLAEELEANCADMLTVRARCDQYEATTPYHPFRSLLRSLLSVDLQGDGSQNLAALSRRLAEVDEELVPWAPLLGAALDAEVDSTREVDDLDPTFWRARLHGVVGQLLGLVFDGPTLLFFEDVHWMDDASSDLLRHLGTQLPSRAWLTCTTRRPGEGGFSAAAGMPPLPALTLRLEAIPDEDAKTLVRAAAGERALGSAELDALMERGAGNPLFLQQLAVADGAGEELETMPESVEALVATRIDRLSPGDRALLRWASVLGVSFSGSLIAAVLEGDSAVAAGSEAWERLTEFVEFDPHVAGAFRFRHALIRDAAYEGLSYKRRRDLHGRVAEVLEERRSDPELLSLHFHRAGRPVEAWRYSLEAGRRAQAKWANLEASQFYERALETVGEVPGASDADVAEVWEALGDCRQLVGRFEDAARAYASARKLVPAGSVTHIGLMHKEGSLREDMGKYSEAIRWYGRGLKAVDALAPGAERDHLRVELEMGVAEVRFRQGEYRDCVRRCGAVVEQALAFNEEKELAAAYLLLHLVHSVLGSPERLSYRGLALPIFEELGDLRGQATVLNNLGIDAYYEGDWRKALDVYRRSRDLFDRIGDVTNVAMATNNIGEILSDQGHLDDAERLFEEVRLSVDAAGHRLLSAVARLNLGRVAARAGRPDEADALLLEAMQAFADIDAASFEQEAQARRAEAALVAGDAERALALADAAEFGGESDAPAALRALLHRIRGLAQARRGHDGKALAELEASVAHAREGDAAYELALSLRAIGELAGNAEAAAEAERLLADLEAVPA